MRVFQLAAMAVVMCSAIADPAPANAEPLSGESQTVFDTTVRPFLVAHCYKCHDDKTTRAGFRIDRLGVDFLAGKTADNWKEVYDNLGVGSMPPKDEARPKADDVTVVMDWIDREIRNAERAAKNSSGRTRRLNRTEYFNTLRDLFELEENYVSNLVDELPPDGKVDGFDRVGASLYIDQSQLAKYVELADRILNQKVFAPKLKPKMTAPAKEFARDIKWTPESENGKYTKVDSMGSLGSLLDKKEIITGPTGAAIYQLKNGGIEYLCGGERIAIGNHSSTSYGAGDGAGGGSWGSKATYFLHQITQEGVYRLKFRAGAFAGKGKYAVDSVKLKYEFGKSGQNAGLDTASITIDAPLDTPQDYVMEIYLHPKPDVPGNNRSILTWNGVPAYGQEMVRGVLTQKQLILVVPEIYQLTNAESAEHYRIVAEEKKKGTPTEKINELLKSRFPVIEEARAERVREYVDAKKPIFSYNPDFDLDAIPRLWLESWEVEGPFVEWPSKARRELFFAGEERPVDESYIREIVARFLPRAYRRTVDREEVDDWVDWVLRAQTQDQLSGVNAVRKGVKAILCSPGFLFIQEPTGDANQPQLLTDFELASRLSYFLWSTMPDAELLKLATEGKLHEPKTLQAQVQRMIADPKSKGFVTNFAGQWLQVHDFGKTMTDRNAYKIYNDDLRKSSWQEPYEFFKEVLRDNLSIIHFVDSDFVMIDNQLATHYGIEGVRGDQFRKVPIRPDQHRGGVLGMAGVLTYLSDGFRTLPVRRAAYVVDTLWNEPAKPPPPNAGDLPAVKGKNLTVRQRLEQHRDSAICASCHTRLDPFGVALENYDAIGKWRERQNGEGFKGDDKSPLLDVSGVLPSSVLPNGRPFQDLSEYKQALLAEKERFVRGFTKKLLTYALGRSVGATDRETVDTIVKAAERDDYRLQSLLQAVVASEAFRMK